MHHAEVKPWRRDVCIPKSEGLSAHQHHHCNAPLLWCSFCSDWKQLSRLSACAVTLTPRKPQRRFPGAMQNKVVPEVQQQPWRLCYARDKAQPAPSAAASAGADALQV